MLSLLNHIMYIKDANEEKLYIKIVMKYVIIYIYLKSIKDGRKI